MAPSTQQVQVFSALAIDFCAWCEAQAPSARLEVQAAAWLAKLHAAALELPETGSDNRDGLPEIAPAHLSGAQRKLSRFNGWYYRTVFDPEPTNNDAPVMGDVGDDLLDIYKDVKAGVVLFEQGRIQEALWHWSFMHRVHWGKHAVDALAALHAGAAKSSA